MNLAQRRAVAIVSLVVDLGIDAATFATRIGDGVRTYLGVLVANTPSAANIRHYAKIVCIWDRRVYGGRDRKLANLSQRTINREQRSAPTP